MGYENDLANLGLLSGGAQGFIKGLQDAEDSSIRREDQKMRKMEMDAKLRTSEEDRTRQREVEQRKKDEYQRGEIIKALQMGKMAPDGKKLSEISPEEWVNDPAHEAMQIRIAEARAGADPFGTKAVGAQKERLQLQEAQKKAQQEQRGFKLPPDKVLQVQAGAQIPNTLAEIEGTLSQNSNLFGPMQGRMGAMNPYDTQSQTVDAQMRSAAQQFGRYMEGGVLRKEDEEKYRKMFPNLTDTPDIAKNKLAIVRKLLVDKQNADVQALKDQGFDVSGFRQLETSQLPKGLGKAKGKLKSGLVAEPKQGLVQEAAAPSGPKGKIHISDGKEDLWIDEKDLADAAKDGFKRVK